MSAEDSQHILVDKSLQLSLMDEVTGGVDCLHSWSRSGCVSSEVHSAAAAAAQKSLDVEASVHVWFLRR